MLLSEGKVKAESLVPLLPRSMEVDCNAVVALLLRVNGELEAEDDEAAFNVEVDDEVSKMSFPSFIQY